MDGGQPMLLTVREAAARLRIGISTMRQLISESHVDTIMVGGSLLRVTVSSLDAYVKSLGKRSHDARA